jgi:hypothetical protein
MREIEIRISPQDFESKALHAHLAKAIRVTANQLPAFRIIRKSLGTQRPPVYQIRF